jgi:hypothetical protein
VLGWLIGLEQLSAAAVLDLECLKSDIENKINENCKTAKEVSVYLQQWSNGDFNWIACTSACYNMVHSALDQQCTIRCRGIQFHNLESSLQNISGNWHHSEQRSSWVELTDSDDNDVHVAHLDAIVSLTCCHPLWDPKDVAVINDCKIALITRHKAVCDTRTNTISMAYSDTMHKPVLRIGLFTGIVIQQLVLLGRNSNKKPIYVGDDVEVLKNKKCITTDSKSIAELVFFKIGTLKIVL